MIAVVHLYAAKLAGLIELPLYRFAMNAVEPAHPNCAVVVLNQVAALIVGAALAVATHRVSEATVGLAPLRTPGASGVVKESVRGVRSASPLPARPAFKLPVVVGVE